MALIMCMALTCNSYVEYINTALKSNLEVEVKQQGMPYIFTLNKEVSSAHEIKLIDTVSNKNLTQNKIAPGSYGDFELIIKSGDNRANIKYYTIIQEDTKKPENLIFWVEGENVEYKEIKELEERLQGKIEKREIQKIKINWIWKSEESDKTDTQDGMNLEEYKFNITIIGKEE